MHSGLLHRLRTVSPCQPKGSRLRLLALAIVLVSAALAVPSASATTAGRSSTTTTVPPALIKTLPKDLQGLFTYTGDVVGPSLYGKFKPVKSPWKICFVDSYEGNPWRIDVHKSLDLLNARFAKAGLTTGTLTAANSNLNEAVENTQIRQDVDRGCNAVIDIAGSSTGTNAAYAYGYKKGVVMVTLDGSVTSPYVININSNAVLWARQMAQAIVTRLGGDGNVIMVEGIAGNPSTVTEDEGADQIFSKYPGIHVVAQVNGNWTPSVTKTVLVQALASHPETIGAVWDTGGECKVIAETFQEAGRPYPLISCAPGADSLAYLHDNPSVTFFGGDIAPTWTADFGFRVAVRLLEGQHPKLNTLYVQIPSFSTKALEALYRPCMTEASQEPWAVEPVDPLPDSWLNGYFWNGKATPPFNYKTDDPQPCG